MAGPFCRVVLSGAIWRVLAASRGHFADTGRSLSPRHFHNLLTTALAPHQCIAPGCSRPSPYFARNGSRGSADLNVVRPPGCSDRLVPPACNPRLQLAHARSSRAEAERVGRSSSPPHINGHLKGHLASLTAEDPFTSGSQSFPCPQCIVPARAGLLVILPPTHGSDEENQ